ncbi:MAG: hypothetical protein AAF958_14125 [Planctomycetota bacterium]
MKALMLASLTTLMIGLAGCSRDESDSQPSASAESRDQQASNDDHHSSGHHAHGAGPHDGVVADWGGGKFHVEFTIDREQKQATVYVLGSDEKTSVPIDAETIELSMSNPKLQLVLSADPQEGDPEGRSSRFIGSDENLVVAGDYAGTLTGVVDGVPYSGDFHQHKH